MNRRGAVLAAALLAACAGTGAEPAPEPRPPSPATAAPPAPRDGVGAPIPADATQLLVARSADWDATAVELASFERGAEGWRPVRRWRGALGRTGLAWGRGRHGAGPPAGHPGPEKREGDGKSPAGVFAIGPGYGHADADTRLPYVRVDQGWRCVDDPASGHYNRVLDAADVSEDWSSAERMQVYRHAVVLDHNGALGPPPAPLPGAGSCIFLHVWDAADEPSVGCTTMSLSDMQALLAWLDPAARPVAVFLPERAYRQLGSAWDLPDLPPR